ncbi:FAD-dependent oxidoreductase [Rhodococcus chondri]|uniref:FAD-binding monooxygenase n=1 Tax=Rhodococcus chondri TaxID=3065941 RepID=A0ABU7JUG1_9NOCA|nr:FAD-binding monooxygenase [Rhodococcus sp. CC-R104]MEE2033665.1 FAD-binding monooxygenase [Rhodococcus sp. CC-R104]
MSKERAVVLGASMSGLLMARILSDVFPEVVVIDRDRLSGSPNGYGSRRGVPQGQHIHVLISRGQQIIEDLFPGSTAELVAAGVPTLDHLGDVRWFLSGNRIRQAESGLRVLSASRPLLEDRIRERVTALPGVTLVERCDAAGLVTDPDHRRVTGVRIIRHADGSAEQVLPADLVVDATGRGSRTPAWLEGLGYQRPVCETVEIDVGYATAMFRTSSVSLDGDKGIVIAPTPGHPRGGALQILERDRCLVTLIGVRGDRPPTGRDEYLDFARSLQFPDLHDAIADAEWLGEPVPYRFRSGMRHRYERLDRFPEGFLVVGDAFCSFNPIYAQGMTVAALEAVTVRKHLAKGSLPGSRDVLRAVARTVDVPWDMAVGGDLAFPGVEGKRDAKVRFGNVYIPRVHAAAARDSTVAVAFARVSGLVDPPSALMRPGIALRVLRHSAGPSLGSPDRVPQAQPG